MRTSSCGAPAPRPAKRSLLVAVLALALLGTPAAAQMAVFDATNYTQNLLAAARALEQVTNQMRSLQNEAVMLENMARNLQQLDVNSLNGMVSALGRINALTAQAQGIAFEVAATQATWDRSYPARYGAGTTQEQLAADALRRWQDAMAAYQHTLVVQAEVAQGVQADTTTLSDLVTASQGAEGALQAAQAGNQLVALSVKQQLQTQSLMAAQYRAQALDQARTAEGAEQARAAFAQFMGRGSAYGN